MTTSRQIAVFGGTGFIGRYVVKRLAAAGFTVRVPTRSPEKALALKPAGNVAQVVPISCSVRSEASVENAIGPSDAVINLIGIMHERGRSSFQSLHVEAAARIARVARAQGAERLIHISALGADSGSASRYARSKIAGEQAVRTFFPEAVILRPSLVFGPEDHFFNRFATMARFLPALPLIGEGLMRFQPVYAGDVADAVMQSLRRDEARGQIYELGGPEVYTFRQMMKLILRLTNRRCWLIDIPWGLAKFKATFLELLPNPPLTRDQVELLHTDNIIQRSGAHTLQDLGIAPTALEVILPTYLARFRKVEKLQAAT